MLKQKLLGAVPFLQSSKNPEEISLAVQAAAVTFLPALTLILGLVGVDADWLKELVNALVGFIGAGLTVYGVIRKFKK